MLQKDVEQFLAERGVDVTPEGQYVLRYEDAVELLTSLLNTGGPLPAYVEVYSRDAVRALVFEEDVTLRDIDDMEGTFEQLWRSVLSYLREYGAEYLVSLDDFALPAFGPDTKRP